MNLCLEGPGARMAAVTQETACPWEPRTHPDPAAALRPTLTKPHNIFTPTRHGPTLPSCKSADECVQGKASDPAHLVRCDRQSHIRKGSVVSMALQTEPDLSAALSAGTPGICLTVAWSFPHGPRAAALVSPALL